MKLKRNTAINLSGPVAMTGVSLVTVPLYLSQIGEARFGVLAIVWLLLGYFDVFDLGISRATTNQISQISSARVRDREQVFWTATVLNGLFGVVGGGLLFALAAPLAAYAVKMPTSLRSEVLSCLPWLALAVPLATISGVFVGVLEGCEQFAMANGIEVGGGILFRLIPLAVAFLHGPDLRWLIISALIARAASVIPLFIAAARATPLSWRDGPAKKWVRPLYSYGGWVTINSILNPFFDSLDRLIIGAGINASAVAVYTVPFNLIRRVRILPPALSRTLFPRFSGLPQREAVDLANRSVKALAAITLPFMVVAAIGMHPFLRFWINPQFAERAAAVGEILVLGTWMDGMSFVPYALLQGQGRPRTVAFIHLLEAPVFAVAIWFGVRIGGVVGAAWVVTIREMLDAVAFMAFAKMLRSVIRQLCVGGAWLIATLLLVRLGGARNYVTLTGEAILVLGSSVWAIRTEPILHNIVVRVPVRALHAVIG